MTPSDADILSGGPLSSLSVSPAVYAASASARPFAFPFLVYHFALAVALFLASFFIVFAVNPAENKAFAAITFAAAIFVILAWEIVSATIIL